MPANEKPGRGRPRKMPGELRLHITARVLPSTLDALNDLIDLRNESRGEIFDRLITKEHKRIIRKEAQ
jgi:hypothetical protein